MELMAGEITRQGTLKRGLLIIASLGAIIWAAFIRANFHPSTGTEGLFAGDCKGRLVRLIMGVTMYSGDNDNSFPPYFTFESNHSRDQFVKVVSPYIPKENLVCKSDEEPTFERKYVAGMEGDPKVMSYVHCQSLKGVIPEYSIGRRALFEGEVEDLSLTTYLRDPIRGFGNIFVGNEKPELIGIQSPHSSGFNVGYLDGHVKYTSALEINSML